MLGCGQKTCVVLAAGWPVRYPPAPMIVAPLPMLAQLERQLARGEHWRYEPKLDGFRGLLWCGAAQISNC
jgi:ATP-dependent DNA ligase